MLIMVMMLLMSLTIVAGRVVYEVTLTNSIRYANNDAIEHWLYDLLCLDVTDLPPLAGGTPDPASCDLYYVNRDTLFSYDCSAETFLKHLVNLYVSSHYKVLPFMHVAKFCNLVTFEDTSVNMCISSFLISSHQKSYNK